MRTRVSIAFSVVGSLVLVALIGTNVSAQTPLVERQPPDAVATTSDRSSSERTTMRLRAGVSAEGRIRFFNVTNPTSHDQVEHALQAVRMLARAALATPSTGTPSQNGAVPATRAQDVVVEVRITPAGH